MAAQPKKKTSKVRSKTRRANQRATLPRLVLCAKCKTPKLPHHICPECGYYGRAKIISTKLDKKVAAALEKKASDSEDLKARREKPKTEKPKKAKKPETTKKIIQDPARTGEKYQKDQE